MTRLVIRICIFFLMTWFAIEAVREAWGAHDVGLFDMFNYFPLLLLAVTTTILLFIDYSYFRLSRKWYQLLPGAAGAVLLSIVIFKKVERYKIDHADTVLEAIHLPNAYNTIGIELKKKNDFRLVEYGILGQVIFYGTYHRSGDSIIIETSNYPGFSGKLPLEGTIKNDTLCWRGFDTLLIHDDTGKTLNSG